MEKRRIRLDINGVVCGLITQESDEYMEALAKEVGEMMTGIMAASPFITREAAALTAALGYCDDVKKNEEKAKVFRDRIEELEMEAEIWQEEKAEIVNSATGPAAMLKAKVDKLEEENTRLTQEAQQVKELEEQAARLEDENAALHRETKETATLRKKVEKLEAENALLQQQVESRPDGGNVTQNEVLALEKARADKAELERENAVAAAKRAMEEARKTVEQLQAELEEAKAQNSRNNSAPALASLERMAEKAGEEPRGDNPGGESPAPARKRRNPLRYEEDFEQVGFVSFFEKK